MTRSGASAPTAVAASPGGRRGSRPAAFTACGAGSERRRLQIWQQLGHAVGAEQASSRRDSPARSPAAVAVGDEELDAVGLELVGLLGATVAPAEVEQRHVVPRDRDGGEVELEVRDVALPSSASARQLAQRAWSAELAARNVLEAYRRVLAGRAARRRRRSRRR